RRPPDVHVENAPAQVRSAKELAVGVGRLGEAHQLRVGALGALVYRHAPARVVLLGLADQRVLSLQQLVPDRNRLRGDAAEHAAHTRPCYPARGWFWRGRSPAARRFDAYGHQGDRTQADLVGAAGQALRARAAGGGGGGPSPGATGGGEWLPEKRGGAGMHLE